jgi:hypothetical protein
VKFRFCIVFFAFAITGCNLYGGLDKPSGDEQILSSARACFDQGDYSCAAKLYSQLSDAASDEATAEEVFLVLNQSGATATALINAVTSSGSNVGRILTQLANSLAPQASEQTRLNLFHAYQKNTSINNLRVRGLIRFLTSLTLMGEIFAENADPVTKKFTENSLVTNPTNCKNAVTNCNNSVLTSCLTISTSCVRPSTDKFERGNSLSPFSTAATDSTMSGAPKLYMILALLEEMQSGLTQMQSSSELGGSAGAISNDILTRGASAIIDQTSPVFRGLLLINGIGS